MRKLYINANNINNGKAVVKGQDAKHLISVMRLSPGSRIELCDGKGTDFKAEIETISSQIVTLKILEKFSSLSESPVHITFAQGMLKDKKMDMLIRHLTELGISEWVPFFADRSIPNPNPKRIRSRMERWKRIAREALNQCGRSVVPHIGDPVQFQDLIQLYKTGYEKIIFWEKASCPIDAIREQDNKTVDRIIILIGPEGGLTENEVKSAEKTGFKTYTLGPRILRAETASIAACSLVQNIFGDLGRKSP